MPEFSRKNSRFSGKNWLNCVRFTCCSSASAWAKSGLIVRSAVRPWVIPYLTSSPTSPVVVNWLPPVSRRERALVYGFTRRSRAVPVCARPVSTPASDTRDRLNARGTGAQKSTSFRRRMCREKLIPQSGAAARSYRSVLNGIAISTTQPSATRRVRTVHTPSQLAFTSRPSFAT